MPVPAVVPVPLAPELLLPVPAPPELEPPAVEAPLPAAAELPAVLAELPTVDAPVPELLDGVEDELEVVLLVTAEMFADAPVGTVSWGAPEVFVVAEPPLPQAPTPTETRTPAQRATSRRILLPATAGPLRSRAGPSACRSSGSR